MKCACGCGRETRINDRTDSQKGWRKGEPRRFIRWHATRPRSQDEFKENPTTGCWEWQRTIAPNGYGVHYVNGKRHLAHRYYFQKHTGENIDGVPLDHLCRNRACVRPSHLEIVTTKENVRRGAATKLTPEDTAKIRELIKEGILSQNAIAENFDVSPQLVCDIKHGRCWL